MDSALKRASSVKCNVMCLIKMKVKIISILIVVVSSHFISGCTSLTTNKSLVPISNNIARIDSYGDFGKFGSGAIFRCKNNTIIVYPIPTEYASSNVFGIIGIPFIPVFVDVEQNIGDYAILRNMDSWDGRLYLAIRFYNDIDLETIDPKIKIEKNSKIYDALKSKKSEYDDADVTVYLYDVMLRDVDKFTVMFQNKDSACEIPNLIYEKSSIFVYKPFILPMP